MRHILYTLSRRVYTLLYVFSILFDPFPSPVVPNPLPFYPFLLQGSIPFSIPPHLIINYTTPSLPDSIRLIMTKTHFLPSQFVLFYCLCPFAAAFHSVPCHLVPSHSLPSSCSLYAVTTTRLSWAEST